MESIRIPVNTPVVPWSGITQQSSLFLTQKDANDRCEQCAFTLNMPSDDGYAVTDTVYRTVYANTT